MGASWADHRLICSFKKVSSSLILCNISEPSLNWTVVYDEKWILYNNQQQPAQWLDWKEAPEHFLKPNVLVAQSCPTLCNPMDFSPPGSSVHEILQARILEWAAIPFSIQCTSESVVLYWMPFKATFLNIKMIYDFFIKLMSKFANMFIKSNVSLSFFKKNIYLFIACTRSLLGHVRSSSLTRDWAWIPCVGSWES